jgi:endonuclease YncB( thermonuclease family)
MTSLHHVLQVRQRFGDDQDNLAALAPDFQKITAGQAGSPVTFQAVVGGSNAFLLIQGYDLNASGLEVLLDSQVVGTLSRGSKSGWSTFILPLPDLSQGEHKLQFAVGEPPDRSLIATAIVQWTSSETPVPPPFPDEAETIVLQGWVNLDIQRQLGGSPDGDTLWLLDGEVVKDIRGIGAKVLANEKINKLRQHAMGVIKRLPIRFQGIDTPETHFLGAKQNYGFLALSKLEEIGGMRFYGKRSELNVQIRCSVHQESILDPNQRVLGYVTLDGLNVNTEMVRLGYAFPFLYDSISPAMQQRLRDDAKAASTAEAGVWREYSSLPVEPIPESKQSSADYGLVNFPTFWRRWAEYRKSGGIGGPSFVDWIKANKDKPLVAAPNNARMFSELIDPSSNRLLVKPWEVVFKE